MILPIHSYTQINEARYEFKNRMYGNTQYRDRKWKLRRGIALMAVGITFGTAIALLAILLFYTARLIH